MADLLEEMMYRAEGLRVSGLFESAMELFAVAGDLAEERGDLESAADARVEQRRARVYLWLEEEQGLGDEQFIVLTSGNTRELRTFQVRFFGRSRRRRPMFLWVDNQLDVHEGRPGRAAGR